VILKKWSSQSKKSTGFWKLLLFGLNLHLMLLFWIIFAYNLDCFLNLIKLPARFNGELVPLLFTDFVGLFEADVVELNTNFGSFFTDSSVKN
jgi:hypothetical protein